MPPLPIVESIFHQSGHLGHAAGTVLDAAPAHFPGIRQVVTAENVRAPGLVYMVVFLTLS